MAVTLSSSPMETTSAPCVRIPHPTQAAPRRGRVQTERYLIYICTWPQGADCPRHVTQAEGGSPAPGRSHGGWLCAAPLAGAVLAQNKGGRVTLFADTCLSRPGALQVAGGAAEEALHELVEEVAREEHVDPGIAAAVEAGQEHGDDKRRG